LRNTRIGKGFFGARGISVERGLMDLNPEEVRIKRELADVCERVIGIFDHTKWRRSALLSFVETDRIDAIVTDANAPPELVEEWRKREVEVVTAEPISAQDAPTHGPVLLRGPHPGRDPEEVADTIGSV
jgi:DeoR/GlpR family transcriptional regulator of sugar metabolism